MSSPDETDPMVQTENNSSEMSRRSFFKRATVLGATAVVVAGGLGTLASALTKSETGTSAHNDHDPDDLKKRDRDILVVAEIAEALAVTTYSNIINIASSFTRLESDDQGCLKAALQEEMSHFLLEQSVTDQFTPFTSFFYPFNMFADAQTTLNTLVTLEDPFIAAYLVGVRNFSTPELRVTAARIMGIEGDHRTLARVVGPNVAAQDGGPIETITGIRASQRA